MEGEGGGGVASEGLEVPDGFSALGEERQAAVPKVVEPAPPQRDASEQGLEAPIDEVLGIEGHTSSGGEHEPVFSARFPGDLQRHL